MAISVELLALLNEKIGNLCLKCDEGCNPPAVGADGKLPHCYTTRMRRVALVMAAAEITVPDVEAEGFDAYLSDLQVR